MNSHKVEDFIGDQSFMLDRFCHIFGNLGSFIKVPVFLLFLIFSLTFNFINFPLTFITSLLLFTFIQ